MKTTYTIEIIKESFEEEGYILLDSSYINEKTNLNYICPKGHSGTVRWDNWNHSGRRCAECSGNLRKDIEFIRNELLKEDYILLSDCYKNAHIKFKYQCPAQHIHFMNWNKWSAGRRCPTCAVKKRADGTRMEYNIVKDSFESASYILLSKTYKDAKQPLDYVCNMGHLSCISWDSWHAGHRCSKCNGIRQSLSQIGDKNPFWKGGISFEPYCHIWTDREYKKSVKERDNNKCLNPMCLGKSRRMALHHVDYNKKNCRPDNLITLCNSCNGAANKDRDWHETWYKTILTKRYNYKY